MPMSNEKIINITVQERLKKGLISDGVITVEQLRGAEESAELENESLSTVLVKSGYVTEEVLVNFIGEKMHIPYLNIGNYSIDRKILELVPEHIARRHTVIPLFKIEDIITIAMSDPLDIIALDATSTAAQSRIETILATDESIHEAIDKYYGVKDVRHELADDRAGGGEDMVVRERPHYPGKTAEMPHKEKEEQPVVRIVESLIARAIEEGASDIHIEPKKDCLFIRFRIDGFLYDKEKLPINLIAPIASRLKIMAGLDISRKRVPQDGRIRDRDAGTERRVGHKDVYRPQAHVPGCRFHAA